MKPVKRWIDHGSGSTPDERRLLRAVQALDPPDGFSEEVWKRLTGAAVATTVSTLSAQAAAKTAAGVGVGAKVATVTAATVVQASAIGSLFGAAIVLVAGPLRAPEVSTEGSAGPDHVQPVPVRTRAAPPHLAQSSEPLAMPPATTGTDPAHAEHREPLDPRAIRQSIVNAPGRNAVDLVPPPALPSDTPRGTDPTELPGLAAGNGGDLAPAASTGASVSNGPVPFASPSGTPPKQSREPVAHLGAGQLRLESAFLAKARAALRTQKPDEALRIVARMEANFGDGLLGQERETVAIEALLAVGQVESARRRAEVFLRASPQSAYAAQVRRMVER